MNLSQHASIVPEHFEKYTTSNKPSKSGNEAGIMLKKSMIHHERCRAIAQLLWSIVPELTIAEMARTNEIVKFGCEGQEYDVRTISRWLSNLKYDRRPGRPRKRL